MAAVADKKELRLIQYQPVKTGILGFNAVEKGELHPLVHQHLEGADRRALLDRNVNIRIGAVKPPQKPFKHLWDDLKRDRDLQPGSLCLLQLAQLAVKASLCLHQLLYVLKVYLPRFCQSDRRTVAVQKRHTDLRLQTGQILGQRRLRYPEYLSGLSDIPRFGDRDKIRNTTQRHTSHGFLLKI